MEIPQSESLSKNADGTTKDNLAKTIEFYFSDANLMKDRWMKKILIKMGIFQ